MNWLTLIIGIIILIFTLTTVIVSIKNTPDNLQGFYGTMFWIISIGGIVGGLILIFISF